MRKYKKEIALFISSFLIAAMVMSFCALFIIADRNTQKTGFNKRSKPLEISLSGEYASLFVNGREYTFSTEPLFRVLESNLSRVGTVVWFFV